MRQHVLSEALQLPEFSQRLLQATNYTARENLEAAFAVYDAPSVSGVVHQTQQDMRRVEAGLDYTTMAQKTFGQIDNCHIEKLTHLVPEDTDQHPTRRTDLAMVVHTHPVFHGKHPRDMLSPSTDDLAILESWSGHNPNHIEGIAIKHERLGGIALLLYGITDSFDPQRLQLIDVVQNTPRTLRLMGEAGVQSATLLFDPKKGRLVSGLDSLDSIF